MYGSRDNEWEYHGLRMENDDADDGYGLEKLHEQVVSSSLGRKTNEKLPVRKKARIEGYNVEKISDEVTAVAGINNQMFSMIPQRWQKEAEEKQAK